MSFPGDIRYASYAAIAVGAARRVASRLLLCGRRGGRPGGSARYLVELRGVSACSLPVIGSFAKLGAAKAFGEKVARQLRFVMSNHLSDEWFTNYSAYRRGDPNLISTLVVEFPGAGCGTNCSDMEATEGCIRNVRGVLGEGVAGFILSRLENWIKEANLTCE